METGENKFPAQWALDLLEPTELDNTEHIYRYYLSPLMAAGGGLGMRLRNVYMNLPPYANMPLIVGASIVCGYIGYLLHSASDIRYARRDAVIRDYIKLHPEDFPEPENRKYADIFQPWGPIR